MSTLTDKIEVLLRDHVDGDVAVNAELLREILKDLRSDENTIATARNYLSTMTHSDECDRYWHEIDCGPGLGPDNPWYCDNGLSREACEAVPCDCGLDDLKRILKVK
jgi:hypothetical protein